MTPETSALPREAQETGRPAESIIGGLIGLERALYPREGIPPFATDRDLHVANGRCAIWLLIDLLRPARVWVPSYLCREGILEAIDPAATSHRFYEVNGDLSVPEDQWTNEILPGDLVILIDYFGFSHDRAIAARAKEQGAWILEDACQALLSSHVGAGADFVLFNIVKWIGVPDGAILRFPESVTVPDGSLRMPSPSWWFKALQASVLRREFDDGVPTRRWFELFRQTEDTMPRGPFAMSELSQMITRKGVDYSVVAERRRNNYQKLLNRLDAFALFPNLDPDVVPLGFPVRVDRRDAVRQRLFDQLIYPPVHWHLDGVVPRHFDESLRLSRTIMTLPCDQRYGEEDMERMAEIFLQSSESPA
ncbi:MAG: hypothetical protein M0042_00025 [Nitrospiraceae bacterium]|nr:hypothetical protein [Nitrospiraceae bacterium]